MISRPDQCLESASAALSGPQGASAGPASQQNSIPDGGQNPLRGKEVEGKRGTVAHGPGSLEKALFGARARLPGANQGLKSVPSLRSNAAQSIWSKSSDEPLGASWPRWRRHRAAAAWHRHDSVPSGTHGGAQKAGFRAVFSGFHL
jgi:hypothetical protein